MNDSRSVIARVDTVKRVFKHGLSQKTLFISLTDTFMNSIIKTTANNLYILPYLDKNNCNSCILAYRHLAFTSNFSVF